MAKQFKVGDKVMIKKTSEFYREDNSSNPRGIVGTVSRDDGTAILNLFVDWSNGSSNVYNPKDLKIAKEKEEENLLAEILYKDDCDDVIEVDTETMGHVYFSTGEMEGPDFERSGGNSVMLNVKQVKKVRKQLKAWLDKQEVKS